ncbi:DNA phosphorothioation-dependent restriction protein DptG [Salinibius halmophilus]|uniref:DNA phosphorothioation-dependent restriction protein DptG n=1 Tax=Salinibius halmophilus TaxID=1853216 RepID=UPI000E67263A|nr:DNA phosphorothioation-dependent restriction protein DptG [Salinibius halmophilus]
MSVLKENLTVGNNTINGYFPARTTLAKEGEFDWEIAAAGVIRALYRKTTSALLTKDYDGKKGCKLAYAVEQYKLLCKSQFDATLDEAEFWQVLEGMYFKNDEYLKLTPAASLLKLVPLAKGAPQLRLSDLFVSMMGGYYLQDAKAPANNFIEQKLVDVLTSTKVLEDISAKEAMSKGILEKPFLPYLSQAFKADIAFLSLHPNYLLEQLPNMLRLYAFLYTTQLALNIRGWAAAPSPKPFYFILENERASRERKVLVNDGYQNAKRFFEYIFPYLAISEMLQDHTNASSGRRIPLWELAQSLTEADKGRLKLFAKDFEKNRFGEQESELEVDSESALATILELAHKQFAKGESRQAAGEKFLRTTEAEICSSFAKARGNIGKIACLNQDYIALMTNLIIGEKDKLSLFELLDGFKERGICFDKQSVKGLIKYYERVGNVEKMSDSGDAINVRKTI